MDGIGLDNMLGAEQLEKMFGEGNAAEETQEQPSGEETQEENNNNSETQEETAEVDFSDLLGNQPESVGSGENTEGNRGAPESNNDSGTPQNLFSSIARILRDKGVFPDLSDDALKEVKDEAALEKLFTDKVNGMFEDKQQRLLKAVDSGATTDELQDYNQALNLSQYLERKDVIDTLGKEGEQGDTLRKQMMYEAYTKVHNFRHEKAVQLIEKSFADGNDVADAKEAYESCKQFYKGKVDDYQQELETRRQENEANQKKQYANLKKQILDTESFYGGVKVDKAIRQKAYDTLTKPVYRDEQGNYLTALQQYQREHPMEFYKNMALMMALTDDFKNVDKLTKEKVKKEVKKGFSELESVLNSTSRKGDGSLNLANTPPDESEREQWQLAI